MASPHPLGVQAGSRTTSGDSSVGWQGVDEIALRIAMARDSLHVIAEALPQIVWTTQPDGTVDYMNKRWFEYTGLTEEETYKETKSAVHPDDLPLYRQRWKEAVASGQLYEMEYRFRRASDGAYRWHLGRGQPVRNSLGKIIKWFGTCTDIHDQKEAEEQVRRLNEGLEAKVRERTKDLEKEIEERLKVEEQDRAKLNLLRTMMDAMPMAAVAADEHFGIMHANTAFCYLFQPDKHSSEITGSHAVHLMQQAGHMFVSPVGFDALLSRIAAQRARSFEDELTLRDGRVLAIDYIAIAGEGNSPNGHLLLLRDITREKRIDLAKSEFVSLASHQLRTPLTAMRWALRRLTRMLGDSVGEGEKHLLSKANISVANMSSTITTMLAISRIEAGIVSLRPVPVPFGEFCEEMQHRFRDEAAARGITLRCHSQPGTQTITDAGFLREVIENLMSNAIKYTPQGGTVTLETRKLNGTTMAITVSDTGYGIPKHQQEKVFSKFFRAENIVDIDTEGTGLGLYLVSQLTKLLRGSISFNSQINKGTTFTLLLPASLD